MNNDVKKADEAFELNFKMMQLDKTPERLEFERDYTLHIFSTRSENKYGYEIGCLYSGYKTDTPSVISSAINGISLAARFNMGNTYGIWLPNDFIVNYDFLEDAVNKELIEKYRFKI